MTQQDKYRQLENKENELNSKNKNKNLRTNLKKRNHTMMMNVEFYHHLSNIIRKRRECNNDTA